MGDPQLTYPVIHVTGTNGKGSTSQMITRLLMAHGLTVGTYTSPHLERINERITRNGEPIGDDDFAEQIAAVADLEGLIAVRPTYFEAVTAAAFRWFADVAVDVAVVEVGLLGRWDATNVVRRAGRRGHQHRPRPHRVRRADQAAHRRGEGGHRQADERGGDRRDRPGAGRGLPRGRGSVDAGARRGLRRAREPARPGRPDARPAHADHGVHRRVRARCTARTRATTPRSRSPRSRRSSPPRWRPTSSPRASPRWSCPGASRCSATSRW